MKLFTLDLSWQGGLVAIAESKEAAVEIWKGNSIHGPYLTQKEIDSIEEHPIESGVSICFMGDS